MEERYFPVSQNKHFSFDLEAHTDTQSEVEKKKGLWGIYFVLKYS